MTEEYLHQIWKDKRIQFHKLKSINAADILVKDVGVYNENQKGPDFQLGCVQIEGVDIFGNIEMHVKSSDWYKHNHHNDKAYNSVVLHIVYEYDQPVIQNGFLIPTIELKGQIDVTHYNSYVLKSVMKNDFPCSKMMAELDSIYLESMKMNAYTERMNSKVELLVDANLSDKSIFYHLIGTAFGTSINKQGFLDLIERVPFKQLRKLKSSKHKSQLLIAESGLIQNSNSEGTNVWHFKGTRPKNFPTVRIKQFAHFVAQYDFDTSFIFLSAKEIKNEFVKMVNRFWEIDFCEVEKINKQFVYLLLINAVVPFLCYKSVTTQDERLHDKAIELLELIPPESNKFVLKWKKNSIEIKNAFDSQSLLSLYRYYCINKKCLTCNVGVKVLES